MLMSDTNILYILIRQLILQLLTMLIFAFILYVFYIFMPFGTHIICQMFL